MPEYLIPGGIIPHDEIRIPIERLRPVTADGVAVCSKCNGSRRFTTRSGKDVGPCFACDGTGKVQPPKEKPVGEEVAVDKLLAIFKRKSEGKGDYRKPFLFFSIFYAYPADSHGRNPGAIYLKANKTKTYLGKIQNGQLFAQPAVTKEQHAAILATMADPLAEAIKYGIETGRCSCCGRTLTNQESKARGIGPICAEKMAF